MCVCVCVCVCVACRVMDTVVGNGHSCTRSSFGQDCLHFSMGKGGVQIFSISECVNSRA